MQNVEKNVDTLQNVGYTTRKLQNVEREEGVLIDFNNETVEIGERAISRRNGIKM